jgi:hypothetical protein
MLATWYQCNGLLEMVDVVAQMEKGGEAYPVRYIR